MGSAGEVDGGAETEEITKWARSLGAAETITIWGGRVELTKARFSEPTKDTFLDAKRSPRAFNRIAGIAIVTRFCS